LRPELEPLARDPARSAVLLDFDGTLSEIVAHPDLARAAQGARSAVEGLAGRYGLVAVVSGRPTEDVQALLGVEGVTYAGHYGATSSGVALDPRVASEATIAADRVDGAWVEDKGSSVAVHYRQAGQPDVARRSLLVPLQRLADEHRLDLIEGKMVLELVPRDRQRKGGAVQRLIREVDARAAMFAGDDLADREAFAALDLLRDEGVATLKVAVRGVEEWPELLSEADLIVPGPAGLVALLRELAEA
jgi:trehalose 6-phosphate phosphatase